MSVRLYAPDHPDGCHISLTNGTTFMVPHDPAGIEMPQEFVKPGLAAGCLPVGMSKDKAPDEAFNKDVQIRTKMEEMYRSDDPTYFTSDGRPNLTKLNTLVGFAVDRQDRDRLWEEVQAGLEGKDDA